MKTLRIALTPGEPAGIGPDLAIALAQRTHAVEVVVIGDPTLLKQRAKQLNLPLRLLETDLKRAPKPYAAGEIGLLPVSTSAPVTSGELDSRNAAYVLETLDLAIDGCLRGDFDALVTGPVQKSVINDAGIPFSGHTEYLAQRTATAKVVMMLATKDLRVALATTHLPLADVPAAITKDSLREVIHVLHRDMQRNFGIAKPRILVCGLNPHAGEGGHLGREDIDVIEPLLNELRDQAIDLRGPLPADTLFTPKYLDHADVALAMYHDQGLPVLKFSGFGHAVNITLGLPIIRTSVDHGTALDLAGSGKADASSLLTALNYAQKMVQSNTHEQASTVNTPL